MGNRSCQQFVKVILYLDLLSAEELSKILNDNKRHQLIVVRERNLLELDDVLVFQFLAILLTTFI